MVPGFNQLGCDVSDTVWLYMIFGFSLLFLFLSFQTPLSPLRIIATSSNLTQVLRDEEPKDMYSETPSFYYYFRLDFFKLPLHFLLFIFDLSSLVSSSVI